MTVTGGNLYQNCLYAEELVKEKRLFDAVISLEVCILLVPSVFILSFKIVWSSLLFSIILKKTMVVLHFIAWSFPFAPYFCLIEHSYLIEILDHRVAILLCSHKRKYVYTCISSVIRLDNTNLFHIHLNLSGY